MLLHRLRICPKLRPKTRVKMADFSFLSDTDESAVEELISQAQDLSVLEQISAVNCSGFTDSALPTELETRFRKLKSFPITKSNPQYLRSSSHKPESTLKNELKDSNRGKKTELDFSVSDEENVIFTPSKQNPDDKNGSKHKLRSVSVASPSNSSNLSTGSEILSASKRNPARKKSSKPKSRNLSFHSHSSSSMEDSPSRSPSPPQKSGCFFCSPKKVSKNSKKKSNKTHISGIDLDWGKDDEILSDLSIFSVKEQKRILKKAAKEEEKINREAEKIVKWAKQASARMNVSDIENELSDSDDSFR